MCVDFTPIGTAGAVSYDYRLKLRGIFSNAIAKQAVVRVHGTEVNLLIAQLFKTTMQRFTVVSSGDLWRNGAVRCVVHVGQLAAYI